MAQLTNAYDMLIYSRYAPDEAQARQDYDEACMRAENENDRYDEALDTLCIMYETHQPAATIRLQKVVVELARKALRRAQSERDAAHVRLARIREDRA